MARITNKKGTESIVRKLEETIFAFEAKTRAEKIGRVLEVSDGVARVAGLASVGALEMLEFPEGLLGLAFNLEEDEVGAVLLGDWLKLREGDPVKPTGRILQVPVGPELLGRVVNPLGEPLDGEGPIRVGRSAPIEVIAPSVVSREPVKTPLQTGIKALDALIPIGRGQRELIIGDRSTGKTQLALDTIVHQGELNRAKVGKPVYSIYVAIGQKASKIARLVAKLRELGALEWTTVVVATASDPAPLLYIAPYAGCAMGEYFRDLGKDALVIYDDLSKHAWAYRQLSLLLRRPAGREAYPGDIFYLHSRLLERAAKLDAKHGGGSLTALPIIETQAGDIAAYIPTNVISITDGQIYLEPDLFFAGIRPAVNIGLSVSRVGGAAQIPAMKEVAGPLRLELAQYRELATFAQFATELDEATRRQIERGKLLTEVLKQEQFAPVPVEEQIVLLTAATRGMLDEVEGGKIRHFEKAFRPWLAKHRAKLLAEILKEKELTDAIEREIRLAVKKFLSEHKSFRKVTEEEKPKEVVHAVPSAATA